LLDFVDGCAVLLPLVLLLGLWMMQLLAEQESAGQQLADLQARGANLDPLLKLLLPSLGHSMLGHPELLPLLLDILHKVPVQEPLVQAVAVQLLQAGCMHRLQQQQADAGSTAVQQLQQVFRVFDSRYPEQLDHAINQVLQQPVTASDRQPLPAGRKHSKQRHQPADASSMFEFVQQCFQGSSHEVIGSLPSDAQSNQQDEQQQQALTLSLAVAAPASQMRIMALQKLDEVCSSSSSVVMLEKQRQCRSPHGVCCAAVCSAA